MGTWRARQLHATHQQAEATELFPRSQRAGGLRRAGQAPPLCLSPPLSGRAVLLASRKLSDLPGRGCHLKAACPRRLTPRRQEPAPTVTSNNPHTQYRKHFSSVFLRRQREAPYVIWRLRDQEGGRLGAGFSALSPGRVQHGWHKRLRPEVWWPRAA